MDQRFELRYVADPAAVFEMITDEEFLTRKLVAIGALSHEVAVVTHPEGGATVRTEQVLPADVPAFARRFVGDTIRVRQTDVWESRRPDGSREGTFAVEIAHLPAKMGGTLRLDPLGGTGTVERLAGVIQVSIPFVGGRLEALAADAVRAAVETEGRVGRAWLSTRRRRGPIPPSGSPR